jgi:hypothetical protein
MTATTRRTNFRLIALAIALIGALVAILFAISPVSVETASAQAQGAGGQYPDGDVGPGGGSGGDSGLLPEVEGGGNPPGGDGGPSANGDDGGGNLPFTGYPLSTLVLLLLILLAAGLLLRGSIAIRDRFRARSAGTLE